jgi:cytochrome c peroxidase
VRAEAISTSRVAAFQKQLALGTLNTAAVARGYVYRTAPLAGLWTHQKGGFFHDGRFATLLDAVNHYDTQFNLNLSEADKKDLIEYLKGI